MKEAAGPSIFSELQMMFQESERSGYPLLLSDLGKFHFGGVIGRHSKESIPDTRGLGGLRVSFLRPFAEWSVFLSNTAKCQIGVWVEKKSCNITILLRSKESCK